MPFSVWHSQVHEALTSASQPANRTVLLNTQPTQVPPPFPSPEDWRDQWIYFLMLDRFNNPAAPPRHLPYDSVVDGFQGGTFNGVRQQLPYLKELGVGALWLSPVLKNCQYYDTTYHGYGIQDFLHIEPRFASRPELAEQEFRALIDEAHRLGIYIILDIVLNHTGDVFAYECHADDTLCLSPENPARRGAQAVFSETPYNVAWRDEHGVARSEWPIVEEVPHPAPDAVLWPEEMRHNSFFRRQGLPNSDETIGDFVSLKQLRTDSGQVQDVLIRAYQYVIAKYDIDGYRIDTLKYINRDFANTFGNAVREYAQSIGKKNFFTFGEVADSEQKIARFIGRNTNDPGELIGVDAALDFPLFYTLTGAAKGLLPPQAVTQMYEVRRAVEHSILSSHGEATNFFVTFLDNHDQHQRFYSRPADNPHRYDDQLTLGLACLFSLQGIPCVYYGTEQGLHGSGTIDQAVREALWGKENAFDHAAPFYRALQRIAFTRANEPALRYGRQYFRPISGNGSEFGVSPFAPGVLAFSRVLSSQEIVVVANSADQPMTSLAVIVDASLNQVGVPYQVLFSNKATFSEPGPVAESGPNLTIHEPDGSLSSGPVRFITVTLQPMEVQILKRSL